MQTLAQDSTAPAGSTFYDRAYSEWLPTTRNAVSSDGSQYAYAGGPVNDPTKLGSVHVVDVATGTEHIVYIGRLSGGPEPQLLASFKVIDFASEGIYLTAAGPDVARGLWILGPGGLPRLISGTILQPAVGNGEAWGLGFNPADPHPGLGGVIGPENEILQYDLSSGSAKTWLYQPGSSFEILGLDYSGNMFLGDQLDSNTYEILEVAADKTTRLVYFDPDFQTTKPAPLGIAAVDSYGVWFDGQFGDSVWLESGGRLQQTATFNQNSYVSIAGGCIPSGS